MERVILSTQDLKRFIELQRRAVENDDKTFVFKDQHYDVSLAEAIIDGYMKGE